jgi:hypothetical protein
VTPSFVILSDTSNRLIEFLTQNYACEDALGRAKTLATAGHHGPALQIIDALPAPFQRTALACRIKSTSLYALGRFQEALECNQVSTAAYLEEPHPHCYQKERIQQAELLINCGQVDAAEALLDEDAGVLTRHYQYCQVRAAIALHHGDLGSPKAGSPGLAQTMPFMPTSYSGNRAYSHF